MVINTIIAGNSALTSRRPDCGGIFVSGGYNLVGITNGSSGWPLSLQNQFGITGQHSWGRMHLLGFLQNWALASSLLASFGLVTGILPGDVGGTE